MLCYDVRWEIKSTWGTYINGAIYINVEQLGDEAFFMRNDETHGHVLGVIVAKTFSPKAGLKKIDGKGRQL